MNTLVVPPSPNWYESSILACSPDNTLIYGARNDLVLVEHSEDSNKASNIRIISRAHSQKIISVHMNRNWGKPNKYVVSVSEDKIIKVWDAETLKKIASQNAHLAHNKVIGANFAGDDRVISVSEEGIIVVWNVGANTTNVLKDVFDFKVTVTCLSTCPHASWLSAFGLKNGLVVVTDLRKAGTLLYKLRGHDKPVVSLSWCPAPINIFPKNPHNSVGVKKEIAADSKGVGSLPTDSPTQSSKSAEKNSLDQNSSESKDKDSAENNTHPLLTVYDSNDEEFCQVFQDLKDRIIGNDSREEVGSRSDTENVFNLTEKVLRLKDENRSTEVCLEKNTEPSVEVTGTNIDDFLKECEDLKSKIEEIEKESDVLVASTSKYANPFEILCSDVPIEQICAEVGGLEDSDIKKDDAISESPEKTMNNKENKEVTEKISEEKIMSIKAADAEDTEECQNVDQNQRIDIKDSTAIIEDTNKQTKDDSPEIRKQKTVEDEKTCVEEEPRKEFLLASSAREGNIYIWRAGTDGRMQNFMTVPNINKSSLRKSSYLEKIWITLCWVSPTTLLSSSKSHELLQWTLPKPMDKSKHVTLVHKDHNTMLFSIAAPISYSNEFNWLEKKQTNAWTVGQDRFLLNTSLCSGKTNLVCYPTFGGTLHCMQLSPVDPNRLAIGSSDGHIKVWDLSRPHVKQIIMTSFHNKIQGKVESLAWHPENELLLAFGTSEGRVGYLDSNNMSKSPVLFPHFFKSQIYRLEWGPLRGDKKQFGLYAVAEGKIVVFDASKKSGDEPMELNKPEKTFLYSFAWKPDYSMLLASTKAGFLIVYSPDLKILRKHYFPQRVQEILWHPDAVQGESRRCRFAAVTNFKNVTVFDFDEENEDDKVMATYEGAGDVVNCISWSPHGEFELVIANENGIVQVWDTKTKEIISTYVNPNFTGVMTALWSPVDPDFMITGGRDSALRIWRISEHAPKVETELMGKRKTVLKELMIESGDLLSKSNKKTQGPSEMVVKKINKNALLPNFPTTAVQVVADLKKLLQWKEDPGCMGMSTGNDGELSIFDVFGTNKDMLKLMNLNETAHKQNGRYSLNAMLTMFRGDLSSTIKDAIDEKRVDSLIISLAPMVSPKLWQAACETYAQQLSDQSDSNPLEIATYLLACHKVEEAINCLCEAHMFKEALALAKCRCTEEDAIINEVLSRWAKHCVFVGNFEIAAQCFIVLGKYEEAASVLFRRSDIEMMEFAAELAEKSGNVELHKAALFRYKAFLAASVATEENAVKEVMANEEIVSQIGSLPDQTQEVGEVIKEEPTNNEIQEGTGELVQKPVDKNVQEGNVTVSKEADEQVKNKNTDIELLEADEKHQIHGNVPFCSAQEETGKKETTEIGSVKKGTKDIEIVTKSEVVEGSLLLETNSQDEAASKELKTETCEKQHVEKNIKEISENGTSINEIGAEERTEEISQNDTLTGGGRKTSEEVNIMEKAENKDENTETERVDKELGVVEGKIEVQQSTGGKMVSQNGFSN